MKVAHRNVILTLACMLLVQLAAAQVPHFSPFTADMQMSSTRPGMGPGEATGKMFVGGGHMRMNMSEQGHETAMITDFATKTVDILMVQQKMYIEHKADERGGRGPGSNFTQDLHPYDPDNPCSNQPDIKCKNIGVETVNGRTCDHWEMTNTKDGKVANVWVDQRLHFPIKMISEDSSILLSNIKEGEPDASQFQIPPDFHKMDMGGMMPPGTGRPPSN
jgi:Domain of unknown function (DUF4412)